MHDPFTVSPSPLGIRAEPGTQVSSLSTILILDCRGRVIPYAEGRKKGRKGQRKEARKEGGKEGTRKSPGCLGLYLREGGLPGRSRGGGHLAEKTVQTDTPLYAKSPESVTFCKRV